MPTKYDVFAKVIEKAPCKPKDLKFDKPIYSHLNSLVSDNWIKKLKRSVKPYKKRRNKVHI